jgi:hypothetical protein
MMVVVVMIMKKKVTTTTMTIMIMPQVRMLYYREMKKFIAIPTAFEGLGNAAVYRRMTARNATALLHVYEKVRL